MVVRVPSGLVTTRDLMIAGVAVPSGTVLDNPQIISIQKLDALLGKGWIAPLEDPYSRRNPIGTPQPMDLAPLIRDAMMDGQSGLVLQLTVTPDGENRKRFNVHMDNGNGPYTLDWDDGTTSTVSGTSSTHTYGDYGTYGVVVVDENDAEGATSIVSDNAPAAPTSLVATPGDASASISFTPGSANNAAITNYQYQVGSGSWTALSPADASSPVTVPGLANDVEVSISLRAVNSVGAGASSSAVTVTPSAG